MYSKVVFVERYSLLRRIIGSYKEEFVEWSLQSVGGLSLLGLGVGLYLQVLLFCCSIQWTVNSCFILKGTMTEMSDQCHLHRM